MADSEIKKILNLLVEHKLYSLVNLTLILLMEFESVYLIYGSCASVVHCLRKICERFFL